MGRAEGRRVLLLLAFLGAEAVAVLALAAASSAEHRAARRACRTQPDLVALLRLNDLAFCTETSYCRHPSQADLFAPHGEHPAVPDHFPAAFVSPPRHRRSGP